MQVKRLFNRRNLLLILLSAALFLSLAANVYLGAQRNCCSRR